MSTVFSDFLTNFESDFWARCILGWWVVIGTRGCDGKVGGERHICRPYTGDLAGVRGNKGNVRRRGKPPPYNNARLNCSNGKVEGRACPALHRGCERLCGNKGMAAGRDKSLPYCKRERLFLSLLLTFYGTYGRLLRRWGRRSGTCRAFSGYRRQRWTG